MSQLRFYPLKPVVGFPEHYFNVRITICPQYAGAKQIVGYLAQHPVNEVTANQLLKNWDSFVGSLKLYQQHGDLMSIGKEVIIGSVIYCRIVDVGAEVMDTFIPEPQPLPVLG